MSENNSNLYVRQRTNESEDDGNDTNSPSNLSNSFSSLRNLRDTFRRSESMLSATGSTTSSKNGMDSPRKSSAREAAIVERSNLVNLCKSIVKELLEQSFRFGRTFESDHVALQHFFIVIEHVLRHGLKPKKALIGTKKDVWDLLQSIEKHSSEAQNITTSVRDLPSIKTQLGRVRAWIRIAMMQKKLADYLQILVNHKDDTLSEYYESHALMMNDEISIIIGILVGLNIIDCNLCFKDVDLDSAPGVIDFSMYLRSTARVNPEQSGDEQDGSENGADGEEHMTVVLDQKNYVEEINRHLNTTIADLRNEVQRVTKSNGKIKEDLFVAEEKIKLLQSEKSELERNGSANNVEPSGELLNERKQRIIAERELEVQIQLKAESDVAMKLLEKDIHEKQDTIVSLRRQLEDIKVINLAMYNKLQECEGLLKHKTELLTKLESQKETMTTVISQLEKKYNSELSSLNVLQETSQTLSMKVAASEERASRCEADLRVEREWRRNLQEKEQKDKEQINALQLQMKKMNDDMKGQDQLHGELERLRRQWAEAQTTLEELGIQLSVSKLQVSELQEQAKNSDGRSYANASAALWSPDDSTSMCKGCDKEFSLTRRKHHCRNCGEIFCKNCSKQEAALPNENGSNKMVRVCDECWNKLQGTTRN